MAIINKGDIFHSRNDGEFEIVSNLGWDNVAIKFPSGFENIVHRNQVLNGKVKDYFKPVYFGVGFIGKRGFTKQSMVSTGPYNRWKSMISRCYNEKDKAYKNYGGSGVTVCNEWHNLQNYYDWIIKFDYKGMDVDKDILSIGAKVYSPSTCSVVSHKENCDHSFSKRYQFKNPKGKIVQFYNLQEFCIKNKLTPANMHKVLNGERVSHKGYSNGVRL